MVQNNVGPEKNVGPKKILVQKNLGSKKCWSKKNFGPTKKILVRKKNFRKKILVVKKICQKNLLKKNLGIRYFLTLIQRLPKLNTSKLSLVINLKVGYKTYHP